VPLTAFWVMPVGLLGLLLLPFGLGGICFAAMGQGIELILAVAETVSDWPGAVVLLARPPQVALVAAALGGLWLCLWQGRWRRFGLIGVMAGIVIGLLHEPPDLFVDARGTLVGVRLDDGRLAVSPWERDGWITTGWLHAVGQEEAAPWPEEGHGGETLRCDGLGCVLERAGQRVAFARRPDALEEDCAAADLVISYPRVERCFGDTPLIGPRALRHGDGLALWLDRDGIDVVTVRQRRGERPWVR
jgi:competence protein ComEC